jgi:ABC-type nickel/cobalt efflux system permease component RcnA
VQDAALVFLGVITFGLLHGINPSHGWTVAVLYSIRNKRPLLSSLTSSSILAGAHFLSSIAVVAAFVLVTMFIQIPQTYLNYAVAAALAILAYLFWKEKTEDLIETQHGHLHHGFTEQLEHEHPHQHNGAGNHIHLHLHQKRSLPTLTAIAAFALVLGFAHEEEFVILTLAVGGINPLFLMVAYATAVAVGLIGVLYWLLKSTPISNIRLFNIPNTCPRLVP